MKVFVDAFDFLRQKFSLPKDFQPTFERNGDWIKLAQMIAADGSFERAFCREFAIDKFNVRVLENFDERNDFQQWLLWLRCKLMNFGYVYRCAKKSFSPKEFVERLFGEIISCRDAKNFDELCAERREILSVMKILPPEKFFTSLLAADKILALKVLTCNSLAEKIFLFKLLQRFTFDELPTVLPILYQTFPLLAKYLSDTQIFSEEHRDYFRRYRWLKVTNTITADFFQRVEELARLKGRDFLTFDSRNKIIGDEYSDDAAIFLLTEWALNISISLPLTLPPSAKIFPSNIASDSAICLPAPSTKSDALPMPLPMMKKISRRLLNSTGKLFLLTTRDSLNAARRAMKFMAAQLLRKFSCPSSPFNALTKFQPFRNLQMVSMIFSSQI